MLANHKTLHFRPFLAKTNDSIFLKNGEKGPKRPKNDLKWSVLWLANFLWKSHIWENSCSRDLGQKGPKKGKNTVFGLDTKWQYSTQLLKILKILFHIWIAGEMYFQIDVDNFFSISTPSTLKWVQSWAISRPKNSIFGLLWKIDSLLFARNGLKWSVLWLADFLRKSHI